MRMNQTMTDFQLFFEEQKVAVFDQGCLSPKDYFSPFALTDVLIAYSGLKEQPIIHFWQLEKAMILGMKDTKVIHLKKGLDVLKKWNYPAVVRNAGGLGVISDTGTLNISLILPHSAKKKLEIDSAYILMWTWIKLAFQDSKKNIKAFEINDSYCPGTFDLSINGKKFAGIAQRRVKNGLAIMIYLSVNGDQKKRGEAVEHFYRESLGNDFGSNGYPPVNPSSMANLDALLQRNLTIEQVKKELLSVFSSSQLDFDTLNEQLESSDCKLLLETQVEKMIERNNVLNIEE